MGAPLRFATDNRVSRRGMQSLYECDARRRLRSWQRPRGASPHLRCRLMWPAARRTPCGSAAKCGALLTPSMVRRSACTRRAPSGMRVFVV